MTEHDHAHTLMVSRPVCLNVIFASSEERVSIVLTDLNQIHRKIKSASAQAPQALLPSSRAPARPLKPLLQARDDTYHSETRCRRQTRRENRRKSRAGNFLRLLRQRAATHHLTRDRITLHNSTQKAFRTLYWPHTLTPNPQPPAQEPL